MNPYNSRLPLSILSALVVFGLSLPSTGRATTSPTAPTVSTSVTSGVSDSAATLYGYVSPNGQETSYAFQYGTTTSYGSQTTLAPTGNGTESIKVSQGVSGLKASTTYHYRMVATNAKGTADGEDMTFTTSAAPAPAPSKPTDYTGGVSKVTYSSAVLLGTVYPHGQNTNYAFQYGTSTAYGSQTPLSAAGPSPADVSQTISGLQANTTYHYRLVVTSLAGEAVGTDRTFTTAKIPLSLQIAGVPNPVPFGSPFTLEGTLSGTGAVSHEIVLQVNRFPFTAGFKQMGNPEVTNSAGAFSFPVVGLDQNARLRVQTVGAPTITSPVLTESVAVRVTFHARRTRRRGVWRLYGTVSPSEVGALVGFQLLRPGHKSINEGGMVVKKTGKSKVSRFSRRVHIRHPGLYRALVVVKGGGYVSSYSAPILIR